MTGTLTIVDEHTGQLTFMGIAIEQCPHDPNEWLASAIGDDDHPIRATGVDPDHVFRTLCAHVGNYLKSKWN